MIETNRDISWHTIEGVATQLGVSARTIDRWVALGTFPGPHRVLGRNAWHTDDIAQWQEARA